MIEIENWTTTELFEYLQLHYIIDEEDDFEDWKHNRSDMVEMVKEHIED